MNFSIIDSRGNDIGARAVDAPSSIASYVRQRRMEDTPQPFHVSKTRNKLLKYLP
jgi:hypothetical protein